MKNLQENILNKYKISEVQIIKYVGMQLINKNELL